MKMSKLLNIDPDVANDFVEEPITAAYEILRGRIMLDANNNALGWYEPSLKMGTPIPLDGNMYLDDAFSKPLFDSPIMPFPNAARQIMLVVPLLHGYVARWFGKTTDDYDTWVTLAYNKDIDALLIYNPSPNPVVINHHTDVFPNRETTGIVDTGQTPPKITLNQDQYALLYGDVKPTVNPNAPWGFTDYEPYSSDVQPSRYIRLAGKFWQSPFQFDIDEYSDGNLTMFKDNIELPRPGVFAFKYAYRNNHRSDNIAPPSGAGIGIPLWYTDDPYAGTWAGGDVIMNIVYFETDSGFGVVERRVKLQTEDFKVRVSAIVGIYGKKVTTNRVKAKLLEAIKWLTDSISYGSPNMVIHPCGCIPRSVSSAEAYDGSAWSSIDPSIPPWSYMDGIAIRGTRTQNGNGLTAYFLVNMVRKLDTAGLGTPRIGYGNDAACVFFDQGGNQVPADNLTAVIHELLLDLQSPVTDVTPRSPETLDIRALWCYGKPWSISVDAPSFAPAGSTVTITVTTDAPDGTPVYLIDKDTGEILAQGTVSGGSCQLTFTMPSRDVNLRVYVGGQEPDLHAV